LEFKFNSAKIIFRVYFHSSAKWLLEAVDLWLFVIKIILQILSFIHSSIHAIQLTIGIEHFIWYSWLWFTKGQVSKVISFFPMGWP
jgi:uncharacterized membrane protein YqaE (UPF0057 family)